MNTTTKDMMCSNVDMQKNEALGAATPRASSQEEDDNMTIKEFCRIYECDFSSIYRKIKRHSEELENHIDSSKRIIELDDYAVEFLIPKWIKALLAQDKEMRTLRTTVREHEKTINRLKSELSELQDIKNQFEILKSKYEETVNAKNTLEEEVKNLKTENEELRKKPKRRFF